MTDESLIYSHKIIVSLDTLVTPHVLTTDAKGGTNIPHGTGGQRIVWTLSKELEPGEFVALSACRPGFEWLSWPPPGMNIFSAPTLVGKGKSLELTDTNDNDDSKGGWIYKLRVKYNGFIYETVLKLDSTVAPVAGEDCDVYAKVLLKDNPVIINR